MFKKTNQPQAKKIKKRFVAAGLSAAAILFCASSAFAAVPPLSVSGNKVVKNGQPANLSGVSLFWSTNGWGGDRFWNANVVTGLKRDWNLQLIRASMGVVDVDGGTVGTYLDDPIGNKNKVKTVVNAAIANDMYVIIDWHAHFAEDYTAEAVEFFTEMAQTYGNSNNVIYEIFNEPINQDWNNEIKPYAEEVISAIRAVDPDNLILVGTPTWGSRPDIAASNPISGTNIAYTLHFYAASHGQAYRNNITTAMNRGAAVFISEWGSVDASGDGAIDYTSTQQWVNFMKQNGISGAYWSLNDKVEGASILKPGVSNNGNWSANNLTPSGTLIKSLIQNWNGTPSSSSSSSTSSSSSAFSVTIQAENRGFQSGTNVSSAQDIGNGSMVANIDSGDWISFSNAPVNIPSAGTYRIEYRVASRTNGTSLTIGEAGGTTIYGSLAVPNTGGTQTWQTISHTVTLTAGAKSFAISGGGGRFNLNWFKVTKL